MQKWKILNKVLDNSIIFIETIDLSIDKVKDTIKTLINKETDLGLLQSILIDFIESKGDYEDLGTCEECGDTISKYTLKV